MKFVIRLLISAIALILVAYFIPGVSIDSFATVLLAALILGLINAFVRPIILILTLPINVLTLGLFTLIVNALMLWIVSVLLPGFSIVNFYQAILGALIYWLINWMISILFNSKSSV